MISSMEEEYEEIVGISAPLLGFVIVYAIECKRIKFVFQDLYYLHILMHSN